MVAFPQRIPADKRPGSINRQILNSRIVSYLECASSINSRKRPFLYDFFTNCLPHFYGETCLISTMSQMRCLFRGGRRIFAGMRIG
jgi:hypothetical protein